MCLSMLICGRHYQVYSASITITTQVQYHTCRVVEAGHCRHAAPRCYCATQLLCAGPHELCKLASGCRISGCCKIVLFDCAVPGVNSCCRIQVTPVERAIEQCNATDNLVNILQNLVVNPQQVIQCRMSSHQGIRQQTQLPMQHQVKGSCAVE